MHGAIEAGKLGEVAAIRRTYKWRGPLRDVKMQIRCSDTTQQRPQNENDTYPSSFIVRCFNTPIHRMDVAGSTMAIWRFRRRAQRGEEYAGLSRCIDTRGPGLRGGAVKRSRGAGDRERRPDHRPDQLEFRDVAARDVRRLHERHDALS